MEKFYKLISEPSLQEACKCVLDDAKDLDALRELSNRYELMKEGNTTLKHTVSGGIASKKKSYVEGKENFLMPAPKERPVRVRKGKNRDLYEEMNVPRSSRATRSSRMTVIQDEIGCVTVKSTRSRATRSTLQATSTELSQNEVTLNVDSDSSFSTESKKSRRGTKKVKESAPRASRRGTRVSKRVSATASTRASTRGSTRTSTRATALANARGSSRAEIGTSFRCDSSVLVGKESALPQEHTQENKRKTRATAIKESTHIGSEESVDHSKSPVPTDSLLSKKKQKQNLLFSPYGKSTAKERVEAFEKLSSHHTEATETKSKGKETVQKGALPGEGHHNGVVTSKVVRTSVVLSEDKLLPRANSPLVKGKIKVSYKKVSSVMIKEEDDEDVSTMEVDEMDVMVEELLKTSNTAAESFSGKKPEEDENNLILYVSAAEEKQDKDDEVDDEWLTDDEDKTPGTKSECISASTCIPKEKTSELSKCAPEVPGSYKALRSRKVNASSKVSLTLSSKAKEAGANPKNAANILLQQKKVVESESKEAELRRQQEKEMEAIKRKEELLRKRTEVSKKKREEKMSKVKRTREEKEKETEAKKVKKAKQPAKKKTKEVRPVVEEKKTPVKQIVEEKQLNSTYSMPEEESNGYDMTPHWAEVSPKQPDNPNDYGVVDKSDCSSEEECDPRKKIPLWTKGVRSEVYYQSFIPTKKISEFWQTKPRALTIEALFGTKVSKNTLKRGLHYRTSSAIWHTPPMKK
ncbi:inner centromere protein-like [Hetaerina americana]|uniref:inner centromere protein-like n=1 Tax=Hetaerina americana TaxID=62018 RepID=UPI003A7F4271